MRVFLGHGRGRLAPSGHDPSIGDSECPLARPVRSCRQISADHDPMLLDALDIYLKGMDPY